MTTNDGAGVQNAVAADFHEVAQHGTELFEASFDFLGAVLHHHQAVVRLDVGGDGTVVKKV